MRAADGAIFRVQFGGLNPLGSARYAKVDGMDGVPMLPAYVGDAWEEVIRGPRAMKVLLAALLLAMACAHGALAHVTSTGLAVLEVE